MRLSFVILGILLAAFTVVSWTGFNYARDIFTVSPLVSAKTEPDTIRLTFAGDIMAHDVNFNRPPYERIYDDVRDILTGDDLSFANLEFPVDAKKPMSTYPRFNVHTPYVQAAVDAGFDVFSASNNHATDQGGDSVVKTAEALSALDESVWSGLRRHEDDPMHPVTINYGNMRIGFLSITLFLNLAEGSKLVHNLNMYDAGRIDAFLEYLSETTPGYDLFILSVHGGTEYRQVPNKRKRELFVKFVEHGVDIVWGHHPHVLQPWEYVMFEGSRKVILYSTGNFISGQTWFLDPVMPDQRVAPTGESALFQLKVTDNGEQVDVTDVSLQFIFNHRVQTMVVRKAESLINDPQLSDAWKLYYTHRYESLKRFELPLAEEE